MTAAATPLEREQSAEKSNLFPAGIPFIVGNEGAERFSYYGMRAILYTYLGTLYAHTMDAGVSKSKATAVAHLFMAAVYAFPMIGAILADRLLGKYLVIFWVSLIYVAGHGVLAVAGRFDSTGNFGAAEMGMYLGLALIAIGSGGIKPCVSANVGDQFSKKNGHLVTKVFQIFYFIINFGSFFSTLITPVLYKVYGPEVAFGVPGIFMAIAAVIFWTGRNRFVRVPPNPGGRIGALDFASSVLLFSPVIALIAAVFVHGDKVEHGSAEGLSTVEFYGRYVRAYLSNLAQTSWSYFLLSAVAFAGGLLLSRVRQNKKQDAGFVAVFLHALQNRAQRKPGMGFFETTREKFGAEAAEGPPAVLRIMVVFSMVSVFWALFDQHASTWIEQAKQMDRVVSMPALTSKWLVYGTVALALYGGAWLISWVSNRPFPKALSVGVGVAVVVVGLVCFVMDMSSGDRTTMELQAAQISALNPLMVMMIIPLLNVAVYKPLEKRGVTIKPLQKMTVGMFLSAAAFGVAALLQERMESVVDAGDKVHVLWQVAQYIVMTTAEVLVSVTGLEFAYTQAPRSMKSTIMGFWLLCVTGGNVLVAFLAPLETVLSLSQFFWVFTVLMAVASGIFAALAATYKGKTYLQEAAR
ncbi:MAG: MFS transporter [Deltaproteobacteria bacterium]|nr:MFS transporter [Deltaproteobacteria bacterium]